MTPTMKQKHIQTFQKDSVASVYNKLCSVIEQPQLEDKAGRLMTINVSEADVTSNETPIKRKPDVADKQNYFA